MLGLCNKAFFILNKYNKILHIFSILSDLVHMNFFKKLKDKIHELRQETEKWPEQARAQVAENMIKSEQSLMKARYEFMNSRLQTKNLPLYKSMDIFLEQFEEKQKEYLLIKEEFIKKNKNSSLTQEQKDFFIDHNDIWLPFLASQDGIIELHDYIINDVIKKRRHSKT